MPNVDGIFVLGAREPKKGSDTKTAPCTNCQTPTHYSATGERILNEQPTAALICIECMAHQALHYALEEPNTRITYKLAGEYDPNEIQ